MRSFRLVSAQVAALLKQHAAKSNATGEIDLVTQTEITRLANQIQEIGQERTKVVDKSQPDRPKRAYRRKQPLDQQHTESVLVS